ncbi:aspartate/glutamate racemase family protein [Alphaproteobacteria bacterium]|nr:aspartate/glutamate racemase family protein [Alphaproteobacteria bacterium]
MTRVAFINPNSTIAMTTSCARSFAAQLPEDYHVDAITNHQAPAAIQGPKDGDAAVPGVLDIIANGKFDAYVIACFDDTGLAEARTITQKPVIGIGQASFHLAALSSERFSVLTTLAVSIPVIAGNIEAQGFGQICDGVYASGVPVLDLETAPDKSCEIISSHLQKMAIENPSNAVILGCAGMTNIWNKLQPDHQITLIDPVAAAAKLIPVLV